MSAFLDTNVILRYLVGDNPEQARRAAETIDSNESLLITDVVLAESAYALTSFYQMGRTMVADSLMELVRRQNITPFALHKDAVLQGLLLCRPSARVSYADAMVWAAARSADTPLVYTFDRRFPAQGIDVRAPGLASS